MPVEQVTVTQIVCDNPACPGNSLDPTAQTGWMFVTASVDGTGVQQVYCSPECAGTIAVVLTKQQEEIAARPAPPELAV